MAVGGPDNAFSKISIIKARMSSETEPDAGFDPRVTQRMEAPPANASQKAAAPPASPIQKAAAPPASPIQKAAAPPANPIQKAAAPPASPIQKAAAPTANPIQKAAAPPASPIQKAAAPPASPIQKAAPPPAAAETPSEAPSEAESASAATTSDPNPSPVILRPRNAPLTPAARANGIAILVTKALGANVGESAVSGLHDLAFMARPTPSTPSAQKPSPATDDTAAPPAESPASNAPAAAPAAVPPPAPAAATREAAPSSEPATSRPFSSSGSTTRPSSPRAAAATVEAFMEGRTDGASLKERELAIALRNLQGAGWSFIRDDGSTESSALDAASAYRLLIDEKRTTSAREGDRLRVVDPKTRAWLVSSADQAASLDYFHGTGAPASLKSPALARKLQALAATGLVAEGEDAGVPGTWGAYVALVRGERAVLRIEGVEFAEARGSQPADVDAAAAPLATLLEVRRDVLLPEVEAGSLHRDGLGPVLQSLHWEVPGVRLPERAQAFLQLARAVPEEADGSVQAARRTASATLAYDAILELDVGGEAFWDAVETMATLLGVVAADDAREPIQFFYREAARSSPFPEARREREEAFRRVIAFGVEPAAAIEITQQIVSRPWDEDLETRIQLFEALADLCGQQPGYTAVMTDYDTVLRFRSAHASLEETAQPYLVMFEALSARGWAHETAPTWAFLHEALRYGHLDVTDGSLAALAERFVALLAQVDNVQEARQRLLH